MPRRNGILLAAIAIFLAWLPSGSARDHALANSSAIGGAAPAVRARADVSAFRARVEAALGDAHAQKALWGILVADRDTGETLFEMNSARSFAPASNAKLVTSILALSTLGPDYKFRTTLESKGALSGDGELSGDLILVGRGDPDLSNRVFPYEAKSDHAGPPEQALAEMADAVAAKGLRAVDGDIVGDDSYFPYDPYPASWSVGDLFFEFGAPVSAIAFNDNTVTITVQPAVQAGDPPVVTIEPAVASDSISLEVKTGPPTAKADFAVVRQLGQNFILLRGIVPAGGATTKLDFAMLDPSLVAARALKQLLEARGIRVTGSVRAQHAPPPDTSDAGDLPPSAESLAALQAPNTLTLAERDSPRLLEIVRVMNKISQNLHAELLLRAVGHEKLGAGTSLAGLKVEQDFLKSAGAADGDVNLSDGSGLARDDLVTPRAMVALLRYAAHQPWGDDFLSTLPVAAIDGTLEGRLKGTPAAGRIEAKTGSLEHVHALSGYATTLRGEHLAFSIFANNDPEHGHDATAALDAICLAMVETLGQPAHAKKK